MTTTIQLQSPGNMVIEMLTANHPVSPEKPAKSPKLKAEVLTRLNLSGQENGPASFGENPCCATKPSKQKFCAKTGHTDFICFFSKLYAGVYEIK